MIRQLSYDECLHLIHSSRADWVLDEDGDLIGVQLRAHRKIEVRPRGVPEPTARSTKGASRASSAVLSKDEIELITDHPRDAEAVTEKRAQRLREEWRKDTPLRLARVKLDAFRPEFLA